MSTLILQPGTAAGIDSYVDADSSDLNFGTSAELHVGTYKTGKSTFFDTRALVLFDVSSLASCMINSATFKLFKISNEFHGATLRVYVVRLTSPWTELGVTWNNRPNYDNSIQDFYDAVSADTFLSFTSMKPLVDDAIARFAGILSLLIWSPGASSTHEDNFTAYSSDHSSSANWPRLQIEYTAPALSLPMSGGFQDLVGNLG